MKGLLLKDFYMIKSVLCILLLAFIVIGIGLSFLTSPWVLTVLATVMLGMIVTTTINMDKTSGWFKISRVLPIPQKKAISSKYILYLLLSAIGLIAGLIISFVITVIQNKWDFDNMFLYVSISIAMALLSGSFMIPCNFLLNEEKSLVGTIIAYPIAAAFFIGLVLLFDNTQMLYIAAVSISMIFYGTSWLFSCKFIANKSI